MPHPIDKQEVPRVSAQAVRQMRTRGDQVHLVCAYDDEEKCRQFELEGALSLGEFERRIDEIERDDELVFYCA